MGKSREAIWAEYYSALGEFMHAFAVAENTLNTQLSKLLEDAVFPTKYYLPTISPEEKVRLLNDPAAGLKGQREAALSLRRQAAIRAALGSKRTNDLAETFKRLLGAIDAEDDTKKKAELIFGQLGEIRYVRDRLAHNGGAVNESGQWVFTSNRDTAVSGDKSDAIGFEIGTLREMSQDLTLITLKIQYLLDPELLKAMEDDPEVAISKLAAKEIRATISAPFQYKPSSLVRSNQRSRATPQSRKPQRRPSRPK